MIECVEGMLLNSQQIAKREKLILVGLYLSKYDSLGLKRLGFESFAEAFNVIGYALGSKPASITGFSSRGTIRAKPASKKEVNRDVFVGFPEQKAWILQSPLDVRHD